MKNAFAVTGLAIVLAVLLSSPTFAQTSNQPPVNATPAPAPAVASETLAADVPLDVVIEEATEDRAKMLMRCLGPPPRPLHTTRAEKELPASEPAVIVSAETTSLTR